ncbi:DMSO/TMAO reductase YedYZ, molybdopterin-dependent catalytic subunit [Nakamurella panacisegetis]|uniref:DMSO/TMAO reductase YedYZ, molybdopterin-dependent catalytic subunit n=1 Tax=Nakamurella panacisegetis TaxID=1090615 RepID=A0A1H0JRV8_9ACTN|nr:molybdopterin-dependent oxidoreductase [Nakamurella panacisegetis]SDO46344.1 DMSO/TMAO reductase YedYZ, molybdopterin-dependent catalytic subunit [Nakamurella panacisegetis]
MTTTSRPTSNDRPAGRGTRPPVWQPGFLSAALIGLVAMGLAIGIAELVAAVGTWLGFLSAGASPITSLGNTFIHLTPEWLKEYAIRTFGQNDKTALRVGMYVTLALVAMLIGLVGRRSPRIAAGATVLLVLVTIGAVFSNSGTGAFDALPIILGGAAGVYLLVTAFRRTVAPEFLEAPTADAAPPATTEPPVAARDTARDGWYDAKPETSGERHPMALAGRPANRPGMDRRQFFRLAGMGAAVAVVTVAVSRWIPSTAQVMASRANAVVPVPTSKQTIPADVDFKINGLTPYATPTGSFYRVDTAFVPPNVTTQEWGLRIHGMVDNEITIDYADLIARPQIERDITLTCVSNPVGGDLAGNATWIGTRVDTLLKEAGPRSGADCVLFTSKDGFTQTAPLDALTDGRDAILAVAMNGEVLPIEHGFPVRMVVPGLYGYVSACKWIVDMKVSRFADESAYWTQRGWSERGPIKTASRIDVPKGFAQLPAGEVTVAGVAWAQHRGINKVEVRIDDGPWEAAQLAGDASVDTWRQWKYVWTATAGTHTVQSRATDGTGTVQTATVRDVLPDGASGYDSRSIVVT